VFKYFDVQRTIQFLLISTVPSLLFLFWKLQNQNYQRSFALLPGFVPVAESFDPITVSPPFISAVRFVANPAFLREEQPTGFFVFSNRIF